MKPKILLGAFGHGPVGLIFFPRTNSIGFSVNINLAPPSFCVLAGLPRLIYIWVRGGKQPA